MLPLDNWFNSAASHTRVSIRGNRDRHVALGALIAITLASIAWSLWIRRITWHSRWEVAATLNIALQGAAVALMSPWASSTLGQWLHTLTGEWNVEDWIGHNCYIVAASSIVYHVIGRLEDPAEFRRMFHRDIEIPATLCITLGLPAFTLGAGARIYQPDFFRIPTDFWLTAYWVIVCGMIAYLLIYGARALLVLRDDPRSRRVADIYLAAAAAGVIAAVCRIAVSFLPATYQDAWPASMTVWVFSALWGAGFALTSACSWRQKIAWITTRPIWTEVPKAPRFVPRLDVQGL